ncbi:MAG: hypothetical protein A2063_11070 [Gallionellales bacterium GWA2_60_142]|nr:MAG: hypothetical protein A2063_11070 [Gallionellales bacterium GWA2_60_142]
MTQLPEITAETTSTQEDKLRRDLLIFACAFINFAVVLWLAIYWLMGLQFSTNIPLGYQLVYVLARYDALLKPAAWTPPAPEARMLQALIARREAIAQDLQRERNRQERASISISTVIPTLRTT